VNFVSLRATSVALLTAGVLFAPAIASAAPAPNSGTLVGSVTCGADEAAPASHISVGVSGVNLNTVTDAAGNFVLNGVPALQNVTIVAVSDPEASVETSRANISVEPGQTLNVGSIDLAVCGQPVDTAPATPSLQDTERSSPGSDY
jgi:hypothetical protein